LSDAGDKIRRAFVVDAGQLGAFAGIPHLSLQLAQALHVLHAQPAVFALPLAQGRFGETACLANSLYQFPHFGQSEGTHDLRA